MSAAGREMGLSPAVVSKRISQLEERLGARLFQRTTRHLTLTETGAGYFKRVVDILSLCEEAEDFVSRRNTKPRGLLKVTMPTAFSRLHIAPYIDDFLARYPEIELDVHIADASSTSSAKASTSPSASASWRIPRSSRAASRPTPASSAPRRPISTKHGTPADLADLETHNCLAADPVDVWRLEGPKGEMQCIPHGNVRSDSGEFIRELVTSGVGIGLLSTWDIGRGAAQRRLARRAAANIAAPRTPPCTRSTPAASSCRPRSTC